MSGPAAESTMPDWEHFAHGADIGIRAWGATPAAAFAHAGNADRVLMLKDGVSQGIFTIKELLEHLGEPVTLRLQIDAAQLPEVLEKLRQAGLTGQVE